MCNALGGGGHLRWSFLFISALTLLLLVTLAPSALARDAYITNEGSGTVSVLDTQTNQVVGTPIKVGSAAGGVAITPDGRFAYVTNLESESVSVVDTQTNQVVSAPIAVGDLPAFIAITPDGRFAYVTNQGSESVSVIDTQTNQVVGTPIAVGKSPLGIAITPDGKRAYVVERGGSVSVIDTQTNQVVGTPIAVGKSPLGIAITPDGRFAYVTNVDSGGVSVIDTQTNQVVGAPIESGYRPDEIAITPDGRFAYVTNVFSGTVSVINIQTNQVVGAPIEIRLPEGLGLPSGIAITPDGKFAYVINDLSESVSVIDTQTNQVVGAPIAVGDLPAYIAITPDQPPLASFSAPHARPGVALTFNASASSDPDGSIASYGWAFGDGQTAPNGGPRPSHTYSAPGTYQATLTLTDNEGCSTEVIFTGQTAYCDGSAQASQTQSVTVAYPGVRLKCPKSAKPRGCRFKLHAVSKKRKGKAESAIASTKLKAGRSAIVSLKPKAAFAVKLSTARSVLVRETVTIKGSKRTRSSKLKIVQ